MAMTKTKRRKRQTTASGQSSSQVFIAILKRHLSESAREGHVERPWNEDDERRYQKQFDRPSPLSHTLGRQYHLGEPHAT